MKKLLMIAASFLAFAPTRVINAQTVHLSDTDKFIAYNSPKKPENYNPIPVKSFKEVNGLVLNRFKENFPGVTDDVWVKKSYGFFVGFTFDGIQNHAFLNAKGYCQSRIRYYKENDLPTGVWHQVKSVYYNYSITSVKELITDNSITFLVTIADKNLWKVIRVINGEMAVYEDHQKG